MSNGVTLYLPRSVLQTMCVQWDNSLSAEFCVTNGAKQGGILSPKLFNVYMDDLSCSLKDLHIGDKIGGIHLSHLFYADDVFAL